MPTDANVAADLASKNAISLLVTTVLPATTQTTMPTLATSGTIDSSEPWTRVTNGGAVTSIVLAAGKRHGQRVIVSNYGTGSITFATALTSFVFDGTNVVIQIKRSSEFIWDVYNTQWMALSGAAT